MGKAATFLGSAALMLASAQLAYAQPGTSQAPGEPASAPQRQVSPQQLEQKAAMLHRVLNESPVAARIAGSQNEQARRHFANARDLTQHAKHLAGEGQLRAADSLLNEAIIEVSKAQQLVPDPGTQQAAERARFSQLEDSVAALRRTALIALPAATAKKAETEQTLRAADTLVDQAVALAKADKYIEANRTLDRALMLLLKDASTRLSGQTIVYDVRFANRREEFDFELERHRSFERLVPLALLEFRPSPEARALVDRHVAQARELRERGEAQVGRDPIAAIKDVVEATDALRRALQAAGLSLPQTMSTP